MMSCIRGGRHSGCGSTMGCDRIPTARWKLGGGVRRAGGVGQIEALPAAARLVVHERKVRHLLHRLGPAAGQGGEERQRQQRGCTACLRARDIGWAQSCDYSKPVCWPLYACVWLSATTMWIPLLVGQRRQRAEVAAAAAPATRQEQGKAVGPCGALPTSCLQIQKHPRRALRGSRRTGQ